MTHWPPPPRTPYGQAPRLKDGDVAYLRVRVRHPVLADDGMPTRAVVIVDKWGRPVDGYERYIPEEQIVTMAEALRAVKGSVK